MAISRRARGSEDGQSLVEFAAALVALLIVVAGVLDIGRAFFTFVAIENAAGEGAIFGSYHPSWVTEADAQAAGADQPQYDNITARAQHESPTGVVDWNLATVEVTHSGPITVGNQITVSVTYSYPIMTPFLNLILEDGVLPLRARAVQRILKTDG